jgi:endonuclease/exonuclease/phosphatase family metal-dependent hydrolase
MRPLSIHFLLCFLTLFLTACGSWSKKNAPKTLITARSAPVKGFKKVAPRFQGTEFLTFDELKLLATNPKPGPLLEEKVSRFFERPIISNEAWFDGVRPMRAQNEVMGEFLRVATWNVEKSIHAGDAARALGSQEAFEAMIDPKAAPPGSKERAELLRERERLTTADIVLLQEMDIGVSRSGYRDAAREIAQALGMNYAYAPQQLEVDPVLLGMEESAKGERSMPDPARYKGVFGLAVLSRYPIKSARCFQLKSQPYDWHSGEKEETALLEDSRRYATVVLFENEMTREIKVGGRIFFQVDLAVPGLPGDTVSVVHNHLEIKARPRGREAQLLEILSHIKGIPHTVVMAGDHNTSRVDLSPTSTVRVLERTTTDPQTWLGVSMNALMSLPMFANSGRVVLNNLKNLHSPMATHIPVLLPNSARSLFSQLKDFRFADGGRFDFRGDRERSINRSTATLANSNEKAFKGQTPTFSVKRPIGPFGRERLDWIFIKPPPTMEGKADDSYRLAPHFGETLSGFLKKLSPRLSDHAPCVADLPLQEPQGL